MTIGILGGSFNPVHIGHLMLASYMQQFGGFDEVWLTLSPLNPLKAGSDELIPDLMRLKMLEIATGTSKGLNVCDYELTMPKPSYTINTLRYLEKRYPRHTFKLIIGSDNWQIFDQWREAQRILDDYGVMVYLRPGYPVDDEHVIGLEVVHAPMIDLSSTFIRRALSKGLNMQYFLPEGVYKYILENRLYGVAPAKTGGRK